MTTNELEERIVELESKLAIAKLRGDAFEKRRQMQIGNIREALGIPRYAVDAMTLGIIESLKAQLAAFESLGEVRKGWFSGTCGRCKAYQIRYLRNPHVSTQRFCDCGGLSSSCGLVEFSPVFVFERKEQRNDN